MLASIKTALLSTWRNTVKEVACPKCLHLIDPYAGRELRHWSDLQVTCPKCGNQFHANEGTSALALAKANPVGPFTRPPETRIELRPAGAGELLIYIPAPRRWGGWLFSALLWNSITLPMFAMTTNSALRGYAPATSALLVLPFVVVGAALAYVAARTRFATHQLHLGPDIVRLQRRLVFNIVRELPTAEIDRVKKAEFYQQNYQPVHGVEIGAGKRRLRFGSILTDAEKNWLCWEIREFLRRNGAPL